MSNNLAVIVGRFQVHYLTAGHIDLINRVLDINENLLILLGTSPSRVSRDNPLTFEMREQMIRRLFPTSKLIIRALPDVGSNKLWSLNLDDVVGKTVLGLKLAGATLYGSRDSFIQHYSGMFPTEEVPHRYTESGTVLRANICNMKDFSEDFRAGAIWAAYHKFPTTYPTVDIAILDYKKKRILLGRKPNETKFRFIGGFAEPESESYEDDAIREVYEETNLRVKTLDYITSVKVDDWRYRRGADKIKTLFFAAEYIKGTPKAKDDIAEVKWFTLRELTPKNLIESHQPLAVLLAKWMLLGKARLK